MNLKCIITLVKRMFADALSRKAHCHCISAIPLSESLCYEMEKLNLSIVPHGTLTHLELTPTLRDLIIAAQKQDKGVKEIQRRLSEGDPKVNCFHQNAENVLWFKNRLVVPKNFSLENRSLMKPILHDYQFIRVATRCTKT